MKACCKHSNQINQNSPLPNVRKIAIKIQTDYQLGPDKAKEMDNSNKFLSEYTFAHLCSRVKTELFWNRNGGYMTCCLMHVSKLVYNYQINLSIYYKPICTSYVQVKKGAEHFTCINTKHCITSICFCSYCGFGNK